MRKNTIRSIVLVMSLAMAGLVGLQYYWITHALRISGEQFKRDVFESMNLVADRLERQEVLFYTYNHLDILGLDEAKFNRFHDSIFSEQFKNFTFSDDNFQFWADSLKKDAAAIIPKGVIPLKPGNFFRFQNGPFPDSLVNNAEVKKWLPDTTKLRVFHENIQISDYNEIFRKQNETSLEHNVLEKAAKKSEMFTVVLEELLYGKKKVENRINPVLLDSLLKDAFLNRGIGLEFSYGVEEQNQQLFVSSPKADSTALQEAEMKVRLYPNDILSGSSYLSVHFPNQQQYLIMKSWLPLLSSFLLILTVIFCFAYAIHIIIRQKKISEIKNDFINNMTHEFKTPISTVSLACEALQDPSLNGSGDFRQRYLRIISDENARLGTQVEKVLQMATLDKKVYKLHIETMSMHGVIEKAIHHLHLQVEKNQATIVTDFAAENPQVEGDKVHLTNIIFNLLDNANKYSLGNPHITIRTYNKLQGIVIRISDQGIGISKDAVQKVFEKFYRVPTGNLHDVKGFGLGLAYVKTMVEAHGGTIAVSSELYKGSTFEVFLRHTYEQN